MVYTKGSTRSEAKPIFWIQKANVFAKSERVQKLAIIISNLQLFSKFSGSLSEFAYHIANLSSVAESSDTSHVVLQRPVSLHLRFILQNESRVDNSV